MLNPASESSCSSEARPLTPAPQRSSYLPVAAFLVSAIAAFSAGTYFGAHVVGDHPGPFRDMRPSEDFFSAQGKELALNKALVKYEHFIDRLLPRKGQDDSTIAARIRGAHAILKNDRDVRFYVALEAQEIGLIGNSQSGFLITEPSPQSRLAKMVSHYVVNPGPETRTAMSNLLSYVTESLPK
jgi:hypothetical protein